MRNFENIDEDNIDKLQKSDACEVCFQRVTDIVNAAEKQKREKVVGGGGDESKICNALRRC
jgi:hypothetical protein